MKKFGSILLIQPRHEKKIGKKRGEDWKRTSIHFPWGLAFLASSYQKAGYRVKVLDAQALQLSKEELLLELDKHDYDVAGITGFSTQYPVVKLLAEHIKATRQAPVLVGGPLATYQANLVLKTTLADVCVIGEGEITGIETLDHYDHLEEVKGIAFTKNSQVIFTPPQDRLVNLDELPFPDFSLFSIETYLRSFNPFTRKKEAGPRRMIFISSRGCPYSCHFCSKSARTYRSMGPQQIYRMLDALKQEFQVEEIVFNDELFLTSKAKFRELGPRMKSLGIRWGAQARVNLMDPEFLDLIQAAGCVGIGLGIESGSQKILDNMNKQTKVEQIEAAMNYTRKIKMPVKVQLIFGYPGEDEDTLRETIELFKRVDHPGRRFNVITPVPGSKLYDDSLRQGLIKDEAAYLHDIEESFGMGKVHVNYTKWPDEEIYPRKREVEREMRLNFINKNLFRRTKYYFLRRAKKRAKSSATID
jgi:radical SAM superfamily enzyme YgiQ (UPF0313 family)